MFQLDRLFFFILHFTFIYCIVFHALNTLPATCPSYNIWVCMSVAYLLFHKCPKSSKCIIFFFKCFDSLKSETKSNQFPILLYPFRHFPHKNEDPKTHKHSIPRNIKSMKIIVLVGLCDLIR